MAYFVSNCGAAAALTQPALVETVAATAPGLRFIAVTERDQGAPAATFATKGVLPFAAIDADPFWVEISRHGRSVAVVDAPFFPARPDIDADQIVEWGCHDRYWGPSSQPEELLDGVLRDVGRHPIGMIDHEYQRFAPCDWIHRSGRHRSPAEVRSFMSDLDHGMQARIELAQAMHRKRSCVDSGRKSTTPSGSPGSVKPTPKSPGICPRAAAS